MDCNSTTYDYLDQGRLTWSGDLPVNGTILLGRTLNILEGPGKLGRQGQHLPGCDVTFQDLPMGVHIDETPSITNKFSRLRLKNSSGAPIHSITIIWKVKPKP